MLIFRAVRIWWSNSEGRVNEGMEGRELSARSTMSMPSALESVTDIDQAPVLVLWLIAVVRVCFGPSYHLR